MSELIHNFGLDWKLMLAQVVNFSILLFLLKKFAYGPVLDILRERKRKIEEGLAAAEESQKKLSMVEKERETVLVGAEREGYEVIKRAEQSAKEKEDMILSEAAKKTEDIFRAGETRLREEKLKMKEDIYRESAEFLKEALAKVVEKSPKEIDDNLIRGVLKELGSLK